jgi:hypothetical protein
MGKQSANLESSHELATKLLVHGYLLLLVVNTLSMLKYQSSNIGNPSNVISECD